MASNLDFVEFVVSQITDAGAVSYKKMFGEYMVYCNEKPIMLICDNTAFVKILPETTAILGSNNKQSYPYHGAKSHYVLDIDDRQQMVEAAKTLNQIIPLPKKKKSK